jgi:hypothetical protein
MIDDSGAQACSVAPLEGRRSGTDRREDMDRRRSAKGLLEMRARREGITSDRRRGERRSLAARSWMRFWRRLTS